MMRARTAPVRDRDRVVLVHVAHGPDSVSMQRGARTIVRVLLSGLRVGWKGAMD